MIPKIIKSEAEYELMLAEIESLALQDPEPNTPDGERLDLLTLLVQNYEARACDRFIPDPIEAILFRMDQQGLSARDLVPLLGSRSKVSEVIARKRPLTLSMIRALHESLRIPASVLLKRSEVEKEEEWIEWERFPVKEMAARGWITIKKSKDQSNEKEAIRQFFSASKGYVAAQQVMYRNSDHVRSGRAMDEYALKAWTARIVQKAQDDPPSVKYVQGTVDYEFIREVIRLSWSEKGPILAREYLRKNGISLVVEPHLPGTYLDGAVILSIPSHPVVGLTLRFDRIDNFWFTLAHELAHLALHADGETKQFYDDLEVEGKDEKERQADELAGEALIPKSEWENSPASRVKMPEAAEHLANKLKIHPAIVAGRMRHVFKSYRLLNNLVGHKQVRRCFTEIEWNGRG